MNHRTAKLSEYQARDRERKGRRWQDPEKRAIDIVRNKAKRARERRDLLERYGGRCACCGEGRIEFLALDHIGGGGNVHRKEVGSGYHMYRWIINNNYPPGFQVLCHNCNMANGFYGYCPHDELATGHYREVSAM